MVGNLGDFGTYACDEALKKGYVAQHNSLNRAVAHAKDFSFKPGIVWTEVHNMLNGAVLWSSRDGSAQMANNFGALAKDAASNVKMTGFKPLF